MTREFTRLGRARATHWRRLTAPLGFLLALTLLAALPTTALATAPEMRGDWEVVMKSSGQTLKGTTQISQEANSKGEFASNTVQFENGLTGTFSGTLKGGEAAVTVTTAPFGPVAAGEFVSTTMTVEAGVSTLALSGSGTFTLGSQVAPGTLTATRTKSQMQIEEQEAQEKREREEREARANVRGEWSLTLEDGPETLTGVTLITEEANSKNEFLDKGATFAGGITGAFSGTLEGAKATVKVTTKEVPGQLPPGEFTSSTITVTSSGSSMSMSGSGNLTLGGPPSTAKFTATRIKSHQELVEIEVKERKAIEQQEKEALEVKEKAEHEAQEKTARETKEKQEREARASREKTEHEAQEKTARETKEKQEREAREAAEKAAIKNTKLVSVQLASKSLTVGATDLLSLQITNPNPYAISGRVTLLTQSGHATAASKKAGSLGTGSFGISPNGEQLVKVKLSKTGRTELAHHKSLHVIVTVTTQATGQTTTTKSFSLTLRAAKPAHAKH